jgi:ABC-type Fe3+-hydroxamate transport system substrate-binding protein
MWSMVRPVIAAAYAVVIVAGCGTSSSGTNATSTPATTEPVVDAPVAIPTTDPAPVATEAPATTTDPLATCTPTDVTDVIVRDLYPDLSPAAQRLGGQGPRDGKCESTLDFLRLTAPTGAGYCEQAALAIDNPGYENTDATVPMKKVLAEFGPGC